MHYKVGKKCVKYIDFFVISGVYFIWDLNCAYLMLHDVLQDEVAYLSDTSQFSVACYTSLKILDA